MQIFTSIEDVVADPYTSIPVTTTYFPKNVVNTERSTSEIGALVGSNITARFIDSELTMHGSPKRKVNNTEPEKINGPNKITTKKNTVRSGRVIEKKTYYNKHLETERDY